MKIFKILLLFLSSSTFSFSQGFFDLDEVNENSLIYSQCKDKWTLLNNKFIEQYTDYKDSILNLPNSNFKGHVELVNKIDSIIENQSAVYAMGSGVNDFNLGLLYNFKQDSAIQQYMQKNNLSYIFGANDYADSYLLYANKNLNFTSQVKRDLSKKPSESVASKSKINFAFANFSEFIDSLSLHGYNLYPIQIALKKATQLVAEENGIDIIIQEEVLNYNIIKIIISGSEKLDITDLILAKYKNQPTPPIQLKINPTLAGVELDVLIDVVGQIHPDFQREKKILWAKYKLLFEDPNNYNFTENEKNFEGEIENLRNKYLYKVKDEIIKESIAISKNLNYDILISLNSIEYGNFFDVKEEIHIAKEHNLTEKVYQTFINKYKDEN